MGAPQIRRGLAAITVFFEDDYFPEQPAGISGDSQSAARIVGRPLPARSVVLALPVTLLVSTAAYRWVELPAIGLARRHAGRVMAYPQIPTY